MEGDCGLLLTRVPCEGAAQLLDLKNSRLVPGTQALDRQWKEDDALLIAGLPRFIQLSLVASSRVQKDTDRNILQYCQVYTRINNYVSLFAYKT